MISKHFRRFLLFEDNGAFEDKKLCSPFFLKLFFFFNWLLLLVVKVKEVMIMSSN